MVAGVRITYGSTIFADNVAPEDDYVVAALREAGIVITGKTADAGVRPALLHGDQDRAARPHAMGPEQVSRRIKRRRGGGGRRGPGPGRAGQRRRRVDPDPVQRLRAVRDQAERGRVSGGPLMPDLAGLSTDGPLARTVADAALLLDAMTCNRPGRHVHPAAAARRRDVPSHASRDPGRLRIGRSLTTAVQGAEVHPDCVAAYEDASALLASLGHDVEDVELPFGPDAVPTFEMLWYSMATLAPIEPRAGEQLLPLTRYLRGKGLALSGPSCSSRRPTCRPSCGPP